METATIKYEVNGDPLETQSPSSENVGSVQNLDESDEQSSTTVNSATSKGAGTGHSILQLTIPAAEVQSVIQPNQQSVIQSATNVQPVQIGKSNVILVANTGKTNSVIQTPQGNLQAVQVVESTDDSIDDDELEEGETPGVKKKRRGILTRRPSYRKILNELGGGEIAVIPASALQINQSDGSIITAGVQYQNSDGQFYIQGGQPMGEDHARKREMRLMKNREAARECRRKKKEYIKCLENRVAVLENQNKALIDELKSLKELYCQQKIE